jgi:hypothetical protein
MHRPPLCIAAFALVLPGAFTPHSAAAQTVAADSLGMPAIVNAVRDSTAAPWRREIARQLADMIDGRHGAAPSRDTRHGETPSAAEDGEWTALLDAPLGAIYSTMIRDIVRNRLVVFGGLNASSTNTTWTLSLSGGAEWTHLLPSEPSRAHGRGTRPSTIPCGTG